MGIRPTKTIGWGIELPYDKVNYDVMEKVFDGERSWNATDFFDFLKNSNIIQQNKARAYVLENKDSYIKAMDKDRDYLEYCVTVETQYFDGDNLEDGTITLVFYPHILVPGLTNTKGIESCKDRFGAFVYAEVENFFPESMHTLETVNYTVKDPVFPSEYFIVQNRDDNEFVIVSEKDPAASGIEIFEQQSFYRLLLGSDPAMKETNLALSGFSTMEELLAKVRLAPPADVFAFAKYTQLFNDDANIFDLKPMVMYSWG